MVAFAFGAPSWTLPNSLIAGIATEKARELGAPIYTQQDIDLVVYIARGGKVEYIKEKSGKPPSTLRMARSAIRWAKKLKIKELWVVATRPHHWRCVRDLEEAALEKKLNTEIRVCHEIMKVPFDNWFSESSTQKRARSFKAWEIRERTLRSLPFWLYKLIDKLFGN